MIVIVSHNEGRQDEKTVVGLFYTAGNEVFATNCAKIASSWRYVFVVSNNN